MIRLGYVDISCLSEDVCQRLYGLIPSQRQQRADRYLRREDARRCIVAGALMRYAAMDTFGTAPKHWAVTREGKPYLPGEPDFHFNLSHSGRWVVIAWGHEPVGIDVEVLSMDEGKTQLAHRFFHRQEQEYLFAAQGQKCARRFFEIWTKKESYLKYLGTGMSRSLSSFSVLDAQALDVQFQSWLWEDAVLTLCARSTECQMLPITANMLLFE